MKPNTKVLVRQAGETEWRNGFKCYFKRIDGKHYCYAGGDKRNITQWDYVKEYKPTLGQTMRWDNISGTMSPLDDPADGGVCDVGLHISNIDGETRKFYNGNYEILLPAGKDATISIILTDDAIDYILDQLNFAKSKN